MNSLFYRTYWKDYPWLRVSLESLKKHAKNWDKVVVTIARSSADKADWDSLMKAHPDIDWRFVDEVCKNDYIGQQFTKMTADHYCGEGTVTYVDSDCVLFEDFEPLDMIEPDGRIAYLYTPYADIPAGAVPWQKPTERFLGRRVEHEFMRRHPMMYATSTLHAARKLSFDNHFVSLRDYFRQLEHGSGRREGFTPTISEFNILGAVAYYDPKEHAKYRWINPGVEPTRPFMKQFWSWGGIDKAREEIASMGYQA